MGKQVWVAEDDAELRKLLATVLRKDGHQVRAFNDGAQLWDALGAVRHPGELPDVVLSDQSMPQLSGVDVLRRLRGSGSLLPFILMTAFPSEETERAVLEHGARVFHKPFDLKRIREAVHTIPARDGADTRPPVAL